MSVLECIGLSKRFGSTDALTNIHLQIVPGHITGLLGPNGSGKSTLIKLACGLLTPSAGQITVCGTAPGKEARAQISYLPDALVKNEKDFAIDGLDMTKPGLLEALGKVAKESVKNALAKPLEITQSQYKTAP